MSRKWVLASACVALLLSFAPAHAKVLPTELHCTATGSGDYWGDWEGSDSWSNIVATGLCVGEPSHAFNASLAGEGDNYFGGGFRLKLTLTDPHTVGSVTLRQTWHNVLDRTLIRSSTGVPTGLGLVDEGDWFNDFSSQELAFAWTFLAFQTP
jgi:hypothetical protein